MTSAVTSRDDGGIASVGRPEVQAGLDGCDQKMSETLARIIDLVRSGEVRISAHGDDEIAEDGILAGEVIDGIEAAAVAAEDDARRRP